MTTPLKVLTDLTSLRGEDEFRDGVMKCVRCSICVPRCPSYAVYRNEADSPRGRVQLMRASMEGRIQIDASFEKHMDQCLGCRACEDACPSAVPFGHLIDRTREVLRPSGRNTGRKRITGVVLTLLTKTVALLWIARIGRGLQWLRLDRALRWVVAPFSKTTAQRLDQLPRVAGAPFDVARFASAPSPTVEFFSGCVMAAAMGDVQRATVKALAQSGHAVGAPTDQGCCGALHLHAGRREEAAQLARQNVDAFGDGDTPICVNSAGCSLAMKEYGHLLADDPAYAARAAAFSSRVRELEALVKLEPGSGQGQAAANGRPLKVAVQEACHHWNVQKLRGRGAALVKDAGVDVVALPIGKGCCGSAGLFSAVNPDAAAKLRDTLLDSIEASGCDVVVSSNPGCLMFIQAGLRARDSKVTAHHLAELVAGDLDGAE